jgi:CBS domain-containing protein
MVAMLVTKEMAHYFRSDLRAAREQAIKDAEAFDQILYAVERLGQHLLGQVKSLGGYSSQLRDVASQSCLSAEIPAMWPLYHVPFGRLFALVKDARNDAMHVGAAARHLTFRAVELALILEDALAMHEKVTLVGDVMVRNPICAELWAPVSFARHTMLSNSFSYLPVMRNDTWVLLADTAVAKFVNGVSNTERKERLALPLSRAIEDGSIEVDAAVCVFSELPIEKMLDGLNGRPFLVVRENEPRALIGIVSAFDLL